MANHQVVAILGAGSGLGAAVARRFAREGYAAALMARRREALAPIRREIEAMGVAALAAPVDAGDWRSVSAAFEEVRKALGDPNVFVYNAGAFHMGGVLETEPEEFERCWRINCLGAFHGLKQAAPAMAARGAGTILLTGATASWRGGSGFSGFAASKFGLRALAQSAARELGPRGVHVAHAVIDGQIDTPRLRAAQPDRDPRTLLSPDAIAETYWQLHRQDPTCWTLELDLRPGVEKF